MWQIYYTKQAKKDAKKLATAGLKAKAKALLEVIQVNPYKIHRPMKIWLETWLELIQEELIFNID